MELATVGTIIGAVLGVPLRRSSGSQAQQPHRPDRTRDRRPCRLFMCRFSGSAMVALVIFYAKSRTGRLPIPAASTSRIEYTFTPVTGFYLARQRSCRDEWDVFWATSFRHLILPAALLGYFSAGLYQPHDAFSFMLNELGAGVYRRSAREGSFRDPGDLGPCSCAMRAWCRSMTVIALSYASLA
jgi:ABC-type dipeptide/oligopeptide/nickel transport system permease component